MNEVDRAEMHALLNRLRGTGIDEPLFRLLELMVLRLDGPFTTEEVPTRPNRPTPPPMPRVSPTPFKNVGRILEGKEPEPGSKR
jgi:hypothetical protein